MENYQEHAQDVLYEYIIDLRQTDNKFDSLNRAFCENAYDASMADGVKSQEYNTAAEKAYCNLVNYLLQKNRYLVRAVLGTDSYVELFSKLVPYLRD